MQTQPDVWEIELEDVYQYQTFLYRFALKEFEELCRDSQM